MATHLIGCLWLFVARVDSNAELSWIAKGHYELATPFEVYFDSFFFVATTMSGIGFGNVLPFTNLEYAACMVIMVVGATIYANFFAHFAVTVYKRNASRIDNLKRLEQAKAFASRRALPEGLKEKIRFYYNNLSLKYGELC